MSLHDFWSEMARACENQAEWFAEKQQTPVGGDTIHDLYQTMQMICTAMANAHKPMDAPPIEMGGE